MMAGVFEMHDKQQWRLSCFARLPDASGEFMRQLKRSTRHVYELSSLSTADAAQKVASKR